MMAVQRALESRRPCRERLFTDPLAASFVSRRWRLVLSVARLGVVRQAVESLYDRIGGPGPRASAIARTRFIDEALEQTAAGAEQIVILGAGFDSRAYRLNALAGRVVYEVDHPATQAFKRARLRRSASSSTVSSVRFVALDFERDDLTRAVLDAGYDVRAPGVFLWEGVTNYLTPAAVYSTLAAIRRLGCPGSALLFTYVEEAALDPDTVAFPEARQWVSAVRSRGEPWIFGLDPGSLADFLRDRRFVMVADTSTAEAGRAYFPPRGREERGSGLYHVVHASIA
jgi:methyltransferase (TIGR00027 family)